VESKHLDQAAFTGYVQYHTQLPAKLNEKFVQALQVLGYVKGDGQPNLSDWFREKARETIEKAERRNHVQRNPRTG